MTLSPADYSKEIEVSKMLYSFNQLFAKRDQIFDRQLEIISIVGYGNILRRHTSYKSREKIVHALNLINEYYDNKIELVAIDRAILLDYQTQNEFIRKTA